MKTLVILPLFPALKICLLLSGFCYA